MNTQEPRCLPDHNTSDELYSTCIYRRSIASFFQHRQLKVEQTSLTNV